VNLLPHHRERLETTSGIAPEAVAARGYYSVESREQLKGLGFPRDIGHFLPALAIPTFAVRHIGPGEGYGQTGLILRPDTIYAFRDGRVARYLSPSSQANVLDLHPHAREWLPDPLVPLVLTEGVIKADAAVSVGLAAIGLGGVDGGWRNGAHSAAAPRSRSSCSRPARMAQRPASTTSSPPTEARSIRLGCCSNTPSRRATSRARRAAAAGAAGRRHRRRRARRARRPAQPLHPLPLVGTGVGDRALDRAHALRRRLRACPLPGDLQRDDALREDAPARPDPLDVRPWPPDERRLRCGDLSQPCGVTAADARLR
jgi:Domain of unknown function (DUF3854)